MIFFLSAYFAYGVITLLSAHDTETTDNIVIRLVILTEEYIPDASLGLGLISMIFALALALTAIEIFSDDRDLSATCTRRRYSSSRILEAFERGNNRDTIVQCLLGLAGALSAWLLLVACFGSCREPKFVAQKLYVSLMGVLSIIVVDVVVVNGTKSLEARVGKVLSQVHGLIALEVRRQRYTCSNRQSPQHSRCTMALRWFYCYSAAGLAYLAILTPHVMNRPILEGGWRSVVFSFYPVLFLATVLVGGAVLSVTTDLTSSVTRRRRSYSLYVVCVSNVLLLVWGVANLVAVQSDVRTVIVIYIGVAISALRAPRCWWLGRIYQGSGSLPRLRVARFLVYPIRVYAANVQRLSNECENYFSRFSDSMDALTADLSTTEARRLKCIIRRRVCAALRNSGTQFSPEFKRRIFKPLQMS